eukprot:scaffold2319_cov406-Prasinococcus_capsulatus_cf.AAC.8
MPASREMNPSSAARLTGGTLHKAPAYKRARSCPAALRSSVESLTMAEAGPSAPAYTSAWVVL